MARNFCIVIAALFSLVSIPSESAEPYPTRRFVIELTAESPGNEQAFRAAVGYDGRLELIEATTPFKKELSAASLTFMFEAADANGVVHAKLYGEQNGSLALFGRVSGRSGKITDEPWHDCVTLSFGPF